MMDFTSSLYLAMKHGSHELPAWKQLTTGLPAALSETAISIRTGQQVAKMQGLQQGICAPSTLHLYWDLFGFPGFDNAVFFIDEKIYQVSKYGVERLLGRNIPVHYFHHQDAEHVNGLIKSKIKRTNKPVVLTDGWCPLCGRAAPVNELSGILEPYHGSLVIDDTQAFGILGQGTTPETPYGTGGGGILKWLGANGRNIVTIVSLAKAFGVPMAVMSGNRPFIMDFKQSSETRISSSPVSRAHLSAARHALSLNKTAGEQRRRKLWRNVSQFRSELKKAGVRPNGSIFPVQSIGGLPAHRVVELYRKLKEEKIKTVLLAPHRDHQPALSFLLRCDHMPGEIQALAGSIRESYCSFSKSFSFYGNPSR